MQFTKTLFAAGFDQSLDFTVKSQDDGNYDVGTVHNFYDYAGESFFKPTGAYGIASIEAMLSYAAELKGVDIQPVEEDIALSIAVPFTTEVIVVMLKKVIEVSEAFTDLKRDVRALQAENAALKTKFALEEHLDEQKHDQFEVMKETIDRCQHVEWISFKTVMTASSAGLLCMLAKCLRAFGSKTDKIKSDVDWLQKYSRALTVNEILQAVASIGYEVVDMVGTDHMTVSSTVRGELTIYVRGSVRPIKSIEVDIYHRSGTCNVVLGVKNLNGKGCVAHHHIYEE